MSDKNSSSKLMSYKNFGLKKKYAWTKNWRVIILHNKSIKKSFRQKFFLTYGVAILSYKSENSPHSWLL